MNVDISFFILPFLLFPLRFLLKTQNWQNILLFSSLILIAYHSVLSICIVFALSAIVYFNLVNSNRYRYFVIIILIIGFIAIKLMANTWVIIGYSYYSLQLLSVLLIPPQNIQFKEIILGAIFFPKFFSGPILKNNQIHFSDNKLEDFRHGLVRFVLGLVKIFILSNRLNEMVSGYFEHPLEINNGLIAVISTILFTIQMYLNFSGFTDIAIGLARVIGVNLPENFNLPLRSKNITDYWRKTHITLISWFNQFIFYPLQYKFKNHPQFALIVGTFLVFVISGLWHNLQIGFIIWGLINAFFIIAEYFWAKWQSKFRIRGVIYVILMVSVANFFFKLGNGPIIIQSLEVLFETNFLPNDYMADIVAVLGKGGYLEQQYHLLETIVLLCIFLFFEKKLNQISFNPHRPIIFVLVGLYLLFLFGNFSQNNQFIYLQF